MDQQLMTAGKFAIASGLIFITIAMLMKAAP